MKKIARIMALVLTVCAFLSLCSCGKQSDEEALAVARDLIDRSYVLNVAYYGEGLPIDEEKHAEGSYYTVSDASAFMTRNDLIVETRAVFSNSIASNLISVYLDGTSSLGVILYARYITGLDGYLTAHKDYDSAIDKVTKYDTSTAEIVKNKRKEIVVRVYTTDKTESTEITLIYEKSGKVEGWRIDSPSY